MLVLSRKVGEKILIGDDISVTVVRVSGGGVRIGIEAPNELPVVREELADNSAIQPPKMLPPNEKDQLVRSKTNGPSNGSQTGAKNSDSNSNMKKPR